MGKRRLAFAAYSWFLLSGCRQFNAGVGKLSNWLVGVVSGVGVENGHPRQKPEYHGQ
jgi:hypothetical protein